MDGALADLRSALRRLRRAPVITALTVGLLALAIGATSGIFKLLDTFALRELPIRDPDTLVHIQRVVDSPPAGDLAVSTVEELARQQQVFSALITWQSFSFHNVDVSGYLSRDNPWFVSGNFFAELGTRPYAGRLLLPADDRSGVAITAVLGYGYWQHRFNGDPNVVGRTIRLEDVPCEIVGILPPRFAGLGRAVEPDLVVPNSARMAVEAATGRPLDPADGLSSAGRLRPGITLAAAASALEAQWPAINAASIPPTSRPEWRDSLLAQRLVVTSVDEGVEHSFRSDVTPALTLALACATLILLIACVNLAGLTLLRVVAGADEWHTRAALGATTWRMARPVFIENLLLALAGAGGGIPISIACIEAFRLWRQSGPFSATVPVDPVPDLRVVLFLSVIVLVVGLFMSTAAIVWIARARHRFVPGGTRMTQRHIGPTLATAQVALSLILLSTAVLLARNIQELRSGDDLHYRRDGVTAVSLVARPNGFEAADPNQYLPRLVATVQAVPGVRSAGLGWAPAPGLDTRSSVTTNDGRPAVRVSRSPASPGFLETLEVSLLSGRRFDWRDDTEAQRVVLISRSLAQQLFGEAASIGRRLYLDEDGTGPAREIVGIMADAKLYDFAYATPLAVYVPQLQEDMPLEKGLIVRTASASPEILAAVRRAVESLGREYVLRTRTLEQRTDDDFASEWLVAALSGAFSAIALILSAVGLFALLSYSVTVRRRELGIRLALGASPRGVVVLIAAQGLRILVTGVVVGLLCTWGTNRLLASQLTAVSPFDLQAVVIAPLMLLVVAAVACGHSAMAAARVDPAITLRTE